MAAGNDNSNDDDNDGGLRRRQGIIMITAGMDNDNGGEQAIVSSLATIRSHSNASKVYDPDAWEDKVEDPSVFDVPPAICKKPTDPKAEVWRIHCGDDGNYNGTPIPSGCVETMFSLHPAFAT